MTSLEATKLTAWLATIYDVPAWTDERIEIFAAEIADLDYAAAQEAARVYVRTHHERPAPADLRAVVAEMQAGLLGPEEAWSELYEWIHGRAQLSPAVAEALHLTGRAHEDLRYLQYDQYPWLRKDFLSAYREVAEKIQTGAQITGRVALPTRDEARAVLTEIKECAPQPLPSPDVQTGDTPSFRTLVDEFKRRHPADVSDQYRGETAEEVRAADARRQQLRDQLRDLEEK